MRAFSEFAHTLANSYEVSEVLYGLAEHVVAILGVAGTGVSLVDEDKRLRPVTSINELTSLLEATEEQFQEALSYIKPLVEREHQEVVSLGGLHILGTERHESRRIDNQLRGRAGRQGDPGSSRFFLSLEDDLMRIFAGDKVKALMQRLGMEKGVAIESKMVSRRIEAAQKSVEARNFETRKHLLQYDVVMNKQR